ncbi:MAG: glycosyltransferase [Cryomorphaceae bacterium]|nr:glycosyltransferase [Cryomorphaceae bacterium]
MKVLIVANKYPYPARDGSSIALMSSIRSWVRSGSEVHLFALNPRKSQVEPDQMPEDLKGKVRTFTHALDTDVNPWGAVKNLLGTRPYHISRFLKEEIQNHLEQVCRQDDYQLIQWEGPFMGEYFEAVRDSVKTHYLRAHNVEHRIWLRVATNQSNPLTKRYLRLQARRLKRFEMNFCEKMDGILPISTVDAIFFKEHFPNKPRHVLLPGVEVATYPQWKESETTDSAVALASFDWAPNREGMEWFFNRVTPLLPKNVKIKIGGRDMPAHWKKQNNLSLIENVSDSKAFLSKGKFNFIPLLSGSGIRIKIVEAISMGIPLVATSIAAEGSGLLPGLHFLCADTPKEFADAMVLLANSQDIRLRLSREARTFALENYDLQKIAADLSNFYRSHHK